MKFAERMSRLGTETAFEMVVKVNKLKAEGRKVISFAIGEPDFDTPENIKQAGIKAIQDNMTHYGPSAGLMDFRKTISEYLKKTRNVDYTEEEIVVVPGGKPIIFFTILACVDPGDEVLYPNPGFPIYESMINFVGANAVPYELLESKGFSFDFEALKAKVTDKTKLIIINSPQNPTGGVIPKEDLEELSKLAIEKDFWILSDEIYSRMVHDGKFESITQFPGMKERTVILDGHSKTYAMTGWRLGYGATNKQMAAYIAQLMTNSNSCTATFTQIAGKEALAGNQDGAEMMAKEFKERRDLIVKLLNDIDGVTCLSPGGAFYVFANVTGSCKKHGFKDSVQVQDYLLYEAGVATLSRIYFGPKNQGETEEYIRLSYATSKEGIKEGLALMKKYLEDEEKIKAFLEKQ